MIDWEKYQASDEYKNSFRWAAHEEHRQGSMWAAWLAGRQSAITSDQWITISDAPKDGRAILGKLPDSDVPQSIRFKEGAWRICWDDTALVNLDTPTHWRELP